MLAHEPRDAAASQCPPHPHLEVRVRRPQPTVTTAHDSAEPRRSGAPRCTEPAPDRMQFRHSDAPPVEELFDHGFEIEVTEHRSEVEGGSQRRGEPDVIDALLDISRCQRLRPVRDDAGRERHSVTTDDQMDDVVVPHPSAVVQPSSSQVRHDRRGRRQDRRPRSATRACRERYRSGRSRDGDAPAHPCRGTGARCRSPIPSAFSSGRRHHSVAQPDQPTELSRDNEHDIPLLTSSVRGKVCDSTAERRPPHVRGGDMRRQ